MASGNKATDKRKNNLKSLADRPQRERNEIARKGAEASNKVQKEKKLLKDSLLLLLETDRGQEMMCTALLERAKTGDTKAFEVIRDTIGQKPIDKSEFSGKIELPSITITK